MNLILNIMDKVSVVIPTYNRFKYLLNAIASVKSQTYQNIEIIVVNDCSTEKEYYEYDFEGNGVKIIHLEKNSRSIFGFACPGVTRSHGIQLATGKYIAFLDDDDIWFPNKLDLQIKAMNETGCEMSCTDGLIGCGQYNPNNKYLKYNAEQNFDYLQNMYQENGYERGFPKIWDLKYLKIHNCCICSSVILTKDVCNKVGNFVIGSHAEDYDYWLKALEHTNCVYLDDVCFYYDGNHGDGQNY